MGPCVRSSWTILATLVEDGQEILKASNLKNIGTDALVSYISTDMDKYWRNNKAVKNFKEWQ